MSRAAGVVAAALGLLRDQRLPRYLAASAAALAVDVGCFLALLAAGAWPAGASALAYSAGVMAHWLLSSRTVFADQVAEGGAARLRQMAQFAGSALAGLSVTFAIVWAGDGAGFDPRLAKLAAIGANFTVNWLLLSRLVFR